MHVPDEWTAADFIPRERDPIALQEERRKAVDDQVRREWYRREIRSRLGAGDTQAQVIAWLVSEGSDPGQAASLASWAATAAPIGVSPPPESDGLVVCVEVVSRSEDGATHVNTDPVASARARAAARKQRTASEPGADPAPEFAFAQPADSTQSRLAYGRRGSGKLLLMAAILLALGVIVAVGLVFLTPFDG